MVEAICKNKLGVGGTPVSNLQVLEQELKEACYSPEVIQQIVYANEDEGLQATLVEKDESSMDDGAFFSPDQLREEHLQ